MSMCSVKLAPSRKKKSSAQFNWHFRTAILLVSMKINQIKLSLYLLHTETRGHTQGHAHQTGRRACRGCAPWKLFGWVFQKWSSQGMKVSGSYSSPTLSFTHSSLVSYLPPSIHRLYSTIHRDLPLLLPGGSGANPSSQIQVW